MLLAIEITDCHDVDLGRLARLDLIIPPEHQI